jgi:precorrin-6A/cobalt-precorrin-6A reductase
MVAGYDGAMRKARLRILILGGTAEARELAERLVGMGHEPITSLAGRTRDPVKPPGALRVGKFGGIPGLVGYLTAHAIDRVVDATHPYAGLISINAVGASNAAGVPLVRYTRPAWTEPAGAGWVHVSDLAAAARALPTNAQVLVTTGHEELEALLRRDDCEFVVRLIEEPDAPLPRHAKLLLTRPPYTVASETALMRDEEITHLVTKNSGGWQTHAKLEAAKALGVTVLMVARPSYPPAREVSTIDEAIAALHLDAS